MPSLLTAGPGGRRTRDRGVLTGGITPVPQGLPAAPTRSGRLLPLLSAPLPAFFAPSRAHRPASLKDDPIPPNLRPKQWAASVRPRKFCSEECTTSVYSDTQLRAIVAA